MKWRILFGVFILLFVPCGRSAVAQPQDDDETPVMFDDMDKNAPSKGDLWYSPDYSHQEGALGYGPKTFAVPESMQERVSFWIDIYTDFI